MFRPQIVPHLVALLALPGAAALGCERGVIDLLEATGSPHVDGAAPGSGGGGGATDGSPEGTCRSDDDCDGFEQRCHPTTGACVECLSPSDCVRDQTCNEETWTCRSPCTSTRDCFFGYCDTTRNSCIECRTDADCQSFFDAEVTCYRDLCIECLSDTDCPLQRPYCDPRSRICLQCLSNADCTPERPNCFPRAGFCGCYGDADCPMGTTCQLDLGCR